MRYLFKVEECNRTGEIGLMLQGEARRDWFNPTTDPANLIHDIIEHPAKPLDNPYGDELMAIGAFYYIRYEGGYTSPQKNGKQYIEENDFAFDISRVLEEGFNDLEIKQPKFHDDNILEHFQNLADQGINSWLRERAAMDQEEVEFDRELLNEYICSWMCKGHSAAKARYAHIASFELGQLFADLERGAIALCKSVDFVGQEFEVRAVFSTGKLTWKDISDYGYED